MVRLWLRRQIEDVRGDPALRAYGVLLAAVHVLGWVHWHVGGQPAAELVGNRRAPVCWPFFDDCLELRLLDETGVEVVLAVYLAVAVVAGLLFLRKRTAGWGMAVLALATVLDAAVLFQDYRLRLNQHTMALAALVVFLVVPDKRRALRWLVVSFYVWAGLLKLNQDWLSGAAFFGLRPLWVPDALLGPSLWYAIVLELLIAPLLLVRWAWVRWLALVQLALFHVASFGVVGFFYPLLGLALLAIFPLSWRHAGREAERPSWTAWVVIGVFAMLQLAARSFPGDTAITGEGRWMALHMFDARVDCEAIATLHEPDGSRPRMRIDARLPVRIACDPLVYFHFARALCRERGELDLVLRSKRASDDELHTVVDVPDFCAADLSYEAFRHNEWIRVDQSRRQR